MNARLSADERRDEVVAAAVIEFAAGGYAGSSTMSIARRAGVSQPYLFQLFGTKRELFLAALADCFTRIGRSFEESAAAARAAGLDAEDALHHMGDEYTRLLLADRDLLRLQLHAYAACGDPEVRSAVRDGFFAVWRQVAAISGGDRDQLIPWFAGGMLINVIATISDARTLEEFYSAVPGGELAPS